MKRCLTTTFSLSLGLTLLTAGAPALAAADFAQI